jgi:hypothetical protein
MNRSPSGLWKWILTLLLSLSAFAGAEWGSPDHRPAPEKSVYNIVGVGVGREEIVFATPADPPSELQWRFRRIPLAGSAPEVRGVSLSNGGTKLLVQFVTGEDRILDLTQKIESINLSDTKTDTHHLPHQLFSVARGKYICLEDESGREVLSSCKLAAAGVVHPDGHILYISEAGSVSISHANGREAEVLPYRVPESTRYKLFAGKGIESTDFLILVQHGDEFELIDPRKVPGTFQSFGSWELGSLHALLAFDSPPGQSADRSQTDQTLLRLAENLAAETSGKNYNWSFYRVDPEVPLYAPVLEFAHDEPVFPSDFEIWNRLTPLSEGADLDAVRHAYESLGQERLQRCTAYYRSISYPGSWLLEFWYYYAYDNGKPRPHIHDSEHLFVEVDKLGGAVRSVLASAHNSINPNNNYSTLVPSAQLIQLPLFALVEFEKHAMSPDINHDGFFTRGIDENLYPDWFGVWGLRDLGAKRGHFMEPYRSWMSLPRRTEDRFGLRADSEYFPNLQLNPERATCQLLPFPRPQPCQDCDPSMIASAESYLANHTDTQHPEHIYKSWVLPWYQLRVGFDLWDHLGHGAQPYVAYVVDLPHLSRRRLLLPSRVALEAMWSPKTSVETVFTGGKSLTFRRSNVTYVGFRFEQLLTNTQGVYFAVNPLFYKFGVLNFNGQPVPFQYRWQYESVWYRVGYLLELPTRRFGNWTNYLGTSFPDFHKARFEWRTSFGLWRRRGRHTFGIRRDDPDPYQGE